MTQTTASDSETAEPVTISVIIPTLNAQRCLSDCLQSVRQQEYDQSLIEIIVADGGSTDKTRRIAESFNARVVDNLARTAETGKAVAARAATADLLLFIDSDNELTSPHWLADMARPLEDPAILASEALYWDLESPRLSRIDRYCALTGANDPLCLFLGNYGRYSYLTLRWTGLPIETTQCVGYVRVPLPQGKLLPTMGANGFLIRRTALLERLEGDYLFDLDIVYELAQRPNVVFARVPVSIAHYYAPSWHDYVKKAERRTSDFFYYSSMNCRSYPWRANSLSGVIWFILYSVLLVPTIAQALRGFAHRPDVAWLFHPFACLITLWVYGKASIRALVGRPQLYDRTVWKQ